MQSESLEGQITSPKQLRRKINKISHHNTSVSVTETAPAMVPVSHATKK